MAVYVLRDGDSKACDITAILFTGKSADDIDRVICDVKNTHPDDYTFDDVKSELAKMDPTIRILETSSDYKEIYW